MKRKLKAYKFLEVSEIIFTLCVINFAVCYYCWYGESEPDFPIFIASMFLAFGCFIYVMANIVLNKASNATGSGTFAHKYLASLKNKKEPYCKYCNSASIHTSYIWRKFVHGVNPQGLMCELLCIVVSALLGGGAYFAVRDQWQYLSIVLPLLIILLLVFVYGIYHFAHGVFRSGNGLMQYVVTNSLSVAEVSRDFRSAERISKNLWISSGTIFYRNYRNVIIVNLKKVKDYKIHEMSVTVRLYNGVMAERMNFNTGKEYNAVCSCLMLLYK